MGNLSGQKLIRFMRVTCQGICVASFGTIGLSPSWGAFIVGIGMLFVSLAFLAYEKGE